MRRELGYMCSHVAFYLLQLLSREEPRWDLPFLAFLVEARWICSLDQNLLELLGDADGEVVGMSLSVLTNAFQKKDKIGKTTARLLAERLPWLFGNDNGHVQLLSIQLFQKLLGLVGDEGKKVLKRIVRQSLLPLFLHCHDGNRRVAKDQKYEGPEYPEF
ncbi:hypothetical protein HGM15179_012368 [Zosterops borbonicus]|uniref:Maestro/Maestro-like HEAT-repeats domain-containing protein n=1 Tax=Zosterops borbonicus TaxID=364589 RepID=A0A8K1LID1_9PASS|nr:hypothetical protein HGM15179_012368 [Zosterops borbonicus]